MEFNSQWQSQEFIFEKKNESIIFNLPIDLDFQNKLSPIKYNN